MHLHPWILKHLAAQRREQLIRDAEGAGPVADGGSGNEVHGRESPAQKDGATQKRTPWRLWILTTSRKEGSVKVGVLVFDHVDVMDVGGPYEAFLTASRLAARRGEEPPFEVVTVGLNTDPVTAYGGLRLIPQVALDEAADLHVLVVPGAIAIEEVIADTRLLRALRHAASRTEVTASVCTGAFVLGELGLLTGRSWTTHWEDVQELSRRVDGKGHSGVQWVDTGAVVTSGGLSSGISMALHLVDRFASRELAERTAKQLEYRWDPEAGVDAPLPDKERGTHRS